MASEPGAKAPHPLHLNTGRDEPSNGATAPAGEAPEGPAPAKPETPQGAPQAAQAPPIAEHQWVVDLETVEAMLAPLRDEQQRLAGLVMVASVAAAVAILLAVRGSRQLAVLARELADTGGGSSPA